MQKETSLFWRIGWTLALAGSLFSGAYWTGSKGKESPTNQRNISQSIEDSLKIDSIPIREIGLPQTNNPDNYVSQEKSSQNKRQSNEQVNYRTTNLQTDPIELLLARLIYGEARGCSIQERIAVGQTALNRSKYLKNKDKNKLREEILRPKQYSCFNLNDINRNKILNPSDIAFEECLEIAKGILLNQLPDYSNSADHYHTKNIKPYWAKSMNPLPNFDVRQKHIFYKSK